MVKRKVSANLSVQICHCRVISESWSHYCELLFSLTGVQPSFHLCRGKKPKQTLHFHCSCCSNVKFFNCWSPYLDHLWTRILFEINWVNWKESCWGVSVFIWCFNSFNVAAASTTSFSTNHCNCCGPGCCLQCPLLLPCLVHLTCSSPACCQLSLFCGLNFLTWLFACLLQKSPKGTMSERSSFLNTTTLSYFCYLK